MTGGLLSLVCYGCDDLYLTGSPEITFFKIVYRRHTNFSVESLEVGLSSSVNFNTEYEVTIPRIGDLISKTYLQIKLPEVYFSKTEFGISPSAVVYDDSFENDYNIIKRMMIDFNNIMTTVNFTLYTLGSDLRAKIESSVTFDSTTKSDFLNLLSEYKAKYIASLTNNSLTKDQKKVLYDEFMYLAKINFYYMIAPNDQTPPVAVIDNFTQTQFTAYFSNAFNNGINTQKYFYKKYQTYLKSYKASTNDNIPFGWIKNIGHNIIDKITVTLGGDPIDVNTGDYFNLYYGIESNYKLDRIYNEMIGNIEELTTVDTNIKPSYVLKVPLLFWFCKSYGQAFPLIASQYSDLKIKVKLKNIEACGELNTTQLATTSTNTLYLQDAWNDKKYTLECSLLVDYIYLDGMERRKFAQSAHEYLIETTQYFTDTLSNPVTESKISTIIDNMNQYEQHKNPEFSLVNFNIKLDFKHTGTQLLWYLKRKFDLGKKLNNTQNISDICTYTTIYGKNPIPLSSIYFNGYTRLVERLGTSTYFNYLEPYAHCVRTPDEGFNYYSFALKTNETQPCGAANFSRISNQVLGIRVDERMFVDTLKSKYTDLDFGCYLRSNNVLRISGGYSSLAFTF